MRKIVLLYIILALSGCVNLSGCSKHAQKMTEKEATGTGQNIGKGAKKTEKGVKQGTKTAKESIQSVKKGYKEEK